MTDTNDKPANARAPEWDGLHEADMEAKINLKIRDLASALERLQFPRRQAK